MKKDRLISLIKNPQVISKEDNESLNHITHKYPFFSISHILLAKGLLNIESIQYNQKLKKAALYSTNRKNLFKLITLEVRKKKREVYNDLNIGKPLEFDKTEMHSFSEWLALTKVKKINRKTKRSEVKIINDFIEGSNSNKVKKNDFFSPAEIAKSSLVENDELVTETLARVYLEQEHFEKAIDAYKKLSLKYPKKSRLFADQINLINDLKDR